MRPVLLALTALLSLVAIVGSPPSAGAQSTTVIDIGDLWFCGPASENGVCQTTVTAGDTVLWQQAGAMPHTTTECGASLDICNPPIRKWDSGLLPGGSGQTFSFTFSPEDAGQTFLYRCQFHPIEMRGSIAVQAPAQPTPTPTPTAAATTGTPTPTPGPTALGAAAGPAQVPDTGSATATGSPPWALAAASGLALLALGAVLLRHSMRPR